MTEIDNGILQKGVIETGYYREPNGKIIVAIYTRLPQCMAMWVGWWFKICLPEMKRSLNQSTKSYISKTRKRPPVNIVEITYLRKYLLDGGIFQLRFDNSIAQYDRRYELPEIPADLYIHGDIILPNGTLNGHVVHFVHDTQFGCEMRSRYFIDNCSKKDALMFMDHNIKGLGLLSDFLRSIIYNSNMANLSEQIRCKFCYSHEIVKYGKRKNKQYWLCKKCGHYFMNNKSFPKMKFPTSIVLQAITDYTSGRSLNDVCSKIEKDYHILPSNSSIHRWLNRFTDQA